MAEYEVETIPDLEEDRQADGDGPAIPETKEETALEAEDRTAPEGEASDEAEAEQQQQQEGNDKFGMLVLAGEIQEYDSEGYNPLMFE
jgi:hypothetical protein